jgi:uncharacterized BrkB/YihY/UPF0761 family membrane protein
MMEFSPYCDPSNALILKNLAVASIVGMALGIAFGKLIRIQIARAKKSPMRVLLMSSLLAFLLLGAFVTLMIYGSIGPNADDCGGTSEHLALPVLVGLITAPTALIGLLCGYRWHPSK